MLDRLARITGAGSDHYEAVLRAGMFGTPVLLCSITLIKLLLDHRP